MKTEPDTIPPESAIFGGGTQSISEIIMNLRTTFRSSDFNRAEEELIGREEALGREISRLKEESHVAAEKHELDLLVIVELRTELAAAKNRSSGYGGGENLERAISAEERLAMAMVHMAAEEKKKERLSSEVSELTRKLEESQKRVASLENDVFLVGLRNSGVKSSPAKPILILDSDDDCPMEAKSPKKELSPWCPTVPKTEQYYSLSPRESVNKNYPNPGDRTVPDDDANQETKAPPIIEPLDSLAKHDRHVKRQFSFSNESNTVPKKTPPPVSERADMASGQRKISQGTQDYELFWSCLSDSD